MINAYKAYWKHYFDFKGRTSRGNYWWAILAQFIVTFLVGFIAGMLDIEALQTLWSLAVFIPSISLCVRRLHDLDRPGWWIILMYVPMILFIASATMTTVSLLLNSGSTTAGGFGLVTLVLGLITLVVAVYFLILFVKTGTEGANRYGIPDND
ncbi:DUF805 domain-containing protein [Anaerostipes sp.]|uniref:DUF805 domain-containing protein n=1 Tax=Anaerostipes sp. TaxID=1872530 RepID=UPI0025C71C8E|nr:DUF805 domain-containing protein [Anaerostipes sp.]MBS7008820.1 DUF805 domain-containing protein [Anaerostipes sp.]